MLQDSKRISWKLAIWLMGLLVIAVVGIAVFGRSPVELKSSSPTPLATPTLHKAQQEVLSEIKSYEQLLTNASSQEEEEYYQEVLEEVYYLATKVWSPTRTQAETNALSTTVHELIETWTPRPTPTVDATGTVESGIYFDFQTPRLIDIDNIWQGYVDGKRTIVYAGNLLPNYMMGEEDLTNCGAVHIRQVDSNNRLLNVLLTTETMPVFWREPGFLRILDDYTDEGTLFLSIVGDNGEIYALDLNLFVLLPSGSPP